MIMSVFTYQTRLLLPDESFNILNDCAALLSMIERKLFKDLNLKKNLNELKQAYLKTYQITARQFNSIRVQVEGKIDSIKEKVKERTSTLIQKIKSINKTIRKLEREGNKKKLHQKKRRLFNLQTKLKLLEKEKKNGKVSLCFGGKKTFRSQFCLKKNGFDSHKEWKNHWQKQRSSEFFILGSKDETGGNQTCTATIDEDGSLSLRLRLPDSLVPKYGKYLIIPNIRFQYGHETILASLKSCLERKHSGDMSIGEAISYRLKVDEKGWRVFATTSVKQPKRVTQEGIGVIGVDINADHLAFAETDRFGNIIEKGTIPLNTYGKSSNQSLAVIGDASAKIVEMAIKTKKPIVLEKLDFQNKKAMLKEESGKRQARLLSSFCYRKILEMIQSRAWAFGVSTTQVNPAYTSLIGLVKFASRYGLSKHHAAAFCIARRYLNLSEEPPKASCIIPDGKNTLVTLPLPARNRDKHVSYFWGAVNRRVKAVLGAHFRTMYSRSSDPPKNERSAR